MRFKSQMFWSSKRFPIANEHFSVLEMEMLCSVKIVLLFVLLETKSRLSVCCILLNGRLLRSTRKSTTCIQEIGSHGNKFLVKVEIVSQPAWPPQPRKLGFPKRKKNKLCWFCIISNLEHIIQKVMIGSDPPPPSFGQNPNFNRNLFPAGLPIWMI